MKYRILIIALLLAFVLSSCSTPEQAEKTTTYKLPLQHEAMHRKLISEQYKFIKLDNTPQDNRQ